MKPDEGHKDGSVSVTLDGRVVAVIACDVFCLHTKACPSHDVEGSVCRCNIKVGVP